ncbi:uncharacterized protein PAC_03742 [Phialocephala subalpina]|uniref:Uncharacterized protein n=1 Tax=Phialocephala subalpina TaxID=576137 RepID=A0A1L7WM79_9HELO|nr:uncharacterized protein PAC_03742 [Phialocephala subalpina]
MGGVASIPTDPSRKVQVISAGYSRTGTVTMSLALAKLLDGPILHGGTQILVRDDGKVDDDDNICGKIDIVPDYCSTWIKAYEARHAGSKETTLKLVRKATAGFVGTADLPPSDFMLEMVEPYPETQKWCWSAEIQSSGGTALRPSPVGRHRGSVLCWRLSPDEDIFHRLRKNIAVQLSNSQA